MVLFTRRCLGEQRAIYHVADWNGDNKADYCVWRPANADYFILYSTETTQHFRFGLSTDKLVTGDYDGDNKADYAKFSQSGTGHIQRSTAGFTSISFGLSTDIPFHRILMVMENWWQFIEAELGIF